MACPIPAIVTAGDRGAAKTVYGESKVYLDLEGKPLVAHVVLALQQVAEISAVWVVGDRARLEAVFASPSVRAALSKPLHLVEQFENLYQNSWQSFRRTLPGAPPEGRDPVGDDLDAQVLFLSADLPFITPREISEFVVAGQATGCDYCIGLSRERSLELFHSGPGRPHGVEVTYFNLSKGRFKQNNLHLTRPARIGNRHYAQDMYDHRKQRKLVNMLGLAWRILTSREGSLTLVFFYTLIHLGGVADRHGWRRLADWIRQTVSLARVEVAIGRLMATSFEFVVPETGGCAIDVDTEQEYDAVREGYATYRARQQARSKERGASA